MANVLKYLTGALSKRAKRRGNLAVGIGEENYGPSSTTGYYNGVTPPENGFVVYATGSNNNPKVFVANSEDDLPAIARTLGGGILSVADSKTYIIGLTNAWILDSVPNNTVTDGLVLDLNVKNKSSYIYNDPTTNLINNPQFTSFSNVFNGDASIVKENFGNGRIGLKFTQFSTANIVSFSPSLTSFTPTSGGTYTFSAEVRSTTTGKTLKNQVTVDVNGVRHWLQDDWTWTTSTYENGNLLRSNVAANTWQRYSVTFTMPTGTLTNFSISGWYRRTSNFVTEIANLQLEEKPTATDFVDGTRSQNTTIYDLSGNGFEGELQNGVTFDSEDPSLMFDGSNDQVAITNSSNFSNFTWSNGLSLVVLYKVDPANLTSNGQYRAFLGVSSGTRSFNYYLRRSSAGNLQFHFSALGYGSLSNTYAADSTKYYMATFVQQNDGTGVYYLDNNYIGSHSQNGVTPAYNSGTATQYVGRADNLTSGNISKVLIYNKPLSESERNQIYYGGPIVTNGLKFAIDASNLVSYESGNTLYDLTGNYTGMSLYGNTSYGSISNGVVNLSASGNADANGCILRSTETISTTLNSDFTTTGWLYRTTSNSAELMSYRETWQRLALEILDNGIYFNQRETVDAGGDGSYNTFQTSVSVTNSRNVWEHFTLSKSGTQWSFYKNGEHIGTNTFSMTETVSGAGFHIGAAWSDDDYLGRGMNGKVGPVMHYTRSLSSDEVLQNYNAQKARFGL